MASFGSILAEGLKRARFGRRPAQPKRDTNPFPNYAPMGQGRTGSRLVWKATPRNLRYFAQTPYARRAINAIKTPIVELDWEIVPAPGVKESRELQRQAEIATYCLKNPNADDAWSQLSRTQGVTVEERAEARRRIIRRAHELGMDTTDWEKISAMRIDAMALVVPDVQDHPNRMPFSGVLTRVGIPSDNAPHGSSGKRVLLTAEAAEAALDSLALMAVDYTPNFDGHDVRAKIGVITGATVEGSDLRIEGFIYAADFPEEAAEIKANKNALGFSFEAQKILVEDLESDPLVITACVFTGAAILLKDKAAYITTSLAASAENAPAAIEDFPMTKEELEAVLSAALKPVTERLDKVEASHNELGSKIEAGKELHAKVAPHADTLRACAASKRADAAHAVVAVVRPTVTAG